MEHGDVYVSFFYKRNILGESMLNIFYICYYIMLSPSLAKRTRKCIRILEPSPLSVDLIPSFYATRTEPVCWITNMSCARTCGVCVNVTLLCQNGHWATWTEMWARRYILPGTSIIINLNLFRSWMFLYCNLLILYFVFDITNSFTCSITKQNYAKK